MSLLLEFGANPHMKDNNDLTPREVVTTATAPVKQLLHHWESKIIYVDSVIDSIWKESAAKVPFKILKYSTSI